MAQETETKGSRFAFLVLALAALAVVAPLLVYGPSCGHDFDFHLLNWLEAAQQFRTGTVHPVWAATPAWNAGEPRFVFYPPLSWVIGAALTRLVAAVARLGHLSGASAFGVVPIAYTFLVVYAGGVAVFRLARSWAGETAALTSAMFYMCSPYALFTAYERAAFGEILSIALFPLLVAEALTGLWPSDAAGPASTPACASIVRPALAIGLLWLSDVPAAVMGCYIFLGLTAARLLALLGSPEARARGLFFFRRWSAGAALGFALAAWFLVPAVAERRWVQLGMAVVVGMRPADNTLFHRTGDPAHDAVLHTASAIAVELTVFFVALLALVLLWRRKQFPRAVVSGAPASQSRGPDAALLFLAGCGAVILFLLTPFSLAIWRSLPELAFLQFPWRFLAVFSVLIAFLSAWALRGLHLGLRPLFLVLGSLVFTLTAPAYRSFHQTCDAEDRPAARFAQVHAPDAVDRGSEPTDEYTPVSADNDALAQANPPFWLLGPAASDDDDAPDQMHGGPAPRVLRLHLEHAARVVLNLRDYPAWSVSRNGTVVRERIARQDGLLAVPLPPGDTDLRITWRPPAASRVGEAVSAGALVALLAVWRRERKRR